MKAVTFITCNCGAQVAPILIQMPEGEEAGAMEIEGVCPVCLTEIQVGLAAKKTVIPSDLSGL